MKILNLKIKKRQFIMNKFLLRKDEGKDKSNWLCHVVADIRITNVIGFSNFNNVTKHAVNYGICTFFLN